MKFAFLVFALSLFPIAAHAETGVKTLLNKYDAGTPADKQLIITLVSTMETMEW
jgi:hypothetical protein